MRKSMWYCVTTLLLCLCVLGGAPRPAYADRAALAAWLGQITNYLFGRRVPQSTPLVHRHHTGPQGPQGERGYVGPSVRPDNGEWITRYTGKGTLCLLEIGHDQPTIVDLLTPPETCWSPVPINETQIAVLVDTPDKGAGIALYSLNDGTTRITLTSAVMGKTRQFYGIIGLYKDDPQRLLVIIGDTDGKEKTLVRVANLRASVMQVAENVPIDDLNTAVPPTNNAAVLDMLCGSRIRVFHNVAKGLDYDENGIDQYLLTPEGDERDRTNLLSSTVDSNPFFAQTRPPEFFQYPNWLTETKIVFIAEVGQVEIIRAPQAGPPPPNR